MNVSAANDVTYTLREWVQYYFSCRECASHFVNLTTTQLPVEQWVSGGACTRTLQRRCTDTLQR